MNNPAIPPINLPKGVTLPDRVYHAIAALQPELLEKHGLTANSPTLEYLRANYITVNEPDILRLFKLATLVSLETDPVLITGETGTGKGIFAEAIARGRPGRFVTLNVTSLPDQLVESELFGHVKGAFTGADRDKTGLLSIAENGTVLLDEIGDLPLSLQPKLLRAVQQKIIRRVGDTQDMPISCRFLCATHRDLLSLTKLWENTKGKEGFRPDLYWRLAVYQLRLLPLTARPVEVISIMCERLGAPIAEIFPAAVLAPNAHWSNGDKLAGNYRELYARVKQYQLQQKLANWQLA